MKILHGLSGGVDSACSAMKLKAIGHDVEGAVLVMHEYTETEAARRSAEELSIKLHVIDCRFEFDKIVKEDFVSEYMSGRTPNPCIICNERVKFKFLYDYAMENGFDAISTGHYARVVKISDEYGERHAIARAKDLAKDQSYMLYRLPESILSKLILPLSDITKVEVRKDASGGGISASERPDSQEICFLPGGNYADYIEEVKGKSEKGSFIDAKGNILGTHNGIIRYTVGQRKGLGISLGTRVFVTDINPKNNTVTLSDTPIGKQKIRLSRVVFSGFTRENLVSNRRVFVKIRYSAPLTEAVAELLENGEIQLAFDAPQRAAPGQSAVAYLDDAVVFGGIIQ